MKLPKDLKEAQDYGYEIGGTRIDGMEPAGNDDRETGEALLKRRAIRVKPGLERDAVKMPYHLIVPMTVTYHFGKPRRARKGEFQEF